MKTIEEIIEDQKNNLGRIKSEKDEAIRDRESREFKLKIASQLLAFLRDETLKTEITNQNDYSVALKRVEDAVRAIPKTERVSVQNLESVISGLDDLKGAVKGIKFPELPKTIIPDNKKELLAIEKAVKDIKIPEVKIPEFPEIPKVDFSELIQAVKKLEKSLDAKLVNFDKKTQQGASESLTELNKGLSVLADSLKRIEEKEYPTPSDRTDEILKGLSKVSNTINNLVFPVPNVDTKSIVDAVNNMKINIENIDIDLDQVETLITATNTKLDTLNSKDYATATNQIPLNAMILGNHTKTYNVDGTIATKVVTYLGTTYTYTYAYTNGENTSKTLVIT